MFIFAWIIKWISSAAFASLATGVVSVLNKRSDSQVAINTENVRAGEAVDLAQLNAEVAAMHEQASLAALRWGWWGTRWLMMAAAAPPIWHYGQVFLDSCRWVPGIAWLWYIPLPAIVEHNVGSWSIAAAPGPYQGSELSVIVTVVGVLTIKDISSGIVSAITKRK